MYRSSMDDITLTTARNGVPASALPELDEGPPDETSRAIGQLVAAEIPDGATLQMGIGAIPDATLDALTQRSDLGIHTEMFSDGLLRLVKSGAVTGSKKTRFKNRIVTSFAMGSRALYDHCDHNPSVEFHPSDVVNDASEIASQYAMMAINSAIAVSSSTTSTRLMVALLFLSYLMMLATASGVLCRTSVPLTM